MHALKKLGVGALAAFFIGVCAVGSFAAEDLLVEDSASSGAGLLWIWGEVTRLDLTSKELSIRYLDYETDLEKEMVVAVDAKTAFENVASLEEIKPLDTASIDYVVSPEGKNLARMISIEKPQDAYESTPQDLNPPEAD